MTLKHLVTIALCFFLFSCGDDTAGTISETDIGIMGHIVTTDGVRAENVSVVALQVDASDKVTPVDTVQTNSEGLYHFEKLSSGTYRLEGSKKIDTLTYVALVDEFTYDSLLFSDSAYKAGTDTLYAPGAVQGVVRLEGASNHLGIDVFIPGTSFDGKSDSLGNFILSGIPEGTSYSLAFMAPGYVTNSELTNIVITKNDTLKLTDTIELKFDPNQVPPAPTGLMASYNDVTKKVSLLWDKVAHPNWEGFLIYRKDSTLSANEPTKISGTALVTDTFFMDDLSGVDLSQEITLQYQVKSQDGKGDKSGYSWPYFVKVGGTQKQTSRIVGTIVSTDGSVTAGATVKLCNVTTATPDTVQKVVTDNSGAYLFADVPSGSYTITTEKLVGSDEYFFISDTLNFDSSKYLGSPLDVGIDTLYLPGAIRGIVKADDGTALTAVLVYIPGTSFIAYTDTLGTFVISYVSPGTYTLTAKLDTYENAAIQNISVTSNDTADVGTITLTKSDPLVPPAPTGVTAVVDKQNVTINWNKVDHAKLTGYSVYRKDTSKSALEPELVSGESLLSDTIWIDESKPVAATYQYQVISHGENSTKSGYSLPAYVTIEPLPDTPIVDSPADEATGLDTALTIVWSGGDTDTFTVEITKDETFSLVEQTEEKATAPLSITGLTYGATYFLRITAKNSVGSTQSAVTTFSTKVKSIPAPKMLFVPGADLTDNYKRKATVTEFYIMEHEVTVEMFKEFQSDYKNLMGDNRPLDPAISVSWGDAIRYANWLSKREGLDTCYIHDSTKSKRADKDDVKSEYCYWPHDTLFYNFDATANGYRLPTGDEFQCAAAGGKGYDYGTDDGTWDTTKAWLWSYDSPALIKQYAPNPFKVYDLTANAWEMVWFSSGAQPDGRTDYIAPADSANFYGMKMGSGFYGYEGQSPRKACYAIGWNNTFKYQMDCGFRLARGAIR